MSQMSWPDNSYLLTTCLLCMPLLNVYTACLVPAVHTPHLYFLLHGIFQAFAASLTYMAYPTSSLHSLSCAHLMVARSC